MTVLSISYSSTTFATYNERQQGNVTIKEYDSEFDPHTSYEYRIKDTGSNSGFNVDYTTRENDPKNPYDNEDDITIEYEYKFDTGNNTGVK
ncbi:hypothetical protein [Vibrio diabolicus]|uniref:hypothetical protein n=1 Tax=Vibrio diabolicus TaxID=50719 RepID=UPI002480FA54|nr:hypothetical protein [Vibrio diabolicus]